ncbi:MAG: sigma-70 family RNA polymerase sigma factor [Bacteroidia bacterium]|nr:sigma-70 family RNA polymerase sigma factor [Bacteroidia bacterium]
MIESKHMTFEELLSSNKGRIIRLCRIYAYSREDQEDLFQEIAYQIWRSMENFRAEAKMETFLYRIALNTSLLYKSKQKKKPPSADLDKVSEPKFEIGIEEKIDKDGRLSWLYHAIKDLKPIEQTLILLYLEEMSYEEISEITGLKVNHVGVKLNRIKKKLSNKVRK